MTHTEPKNMIGYLIAYLQHNSFIGLLASFFTGLILSVTNTANSSTTEWMSYFSFALTTIVAGLTAYAKILEIRNNRKRKKYL